MKSGILNISKYFSTVFILIFLFEAGAYFNILNFISYFSQIKFEKIVSQNLSEDELTLIVFSETNINEIIWTKSKKEFIYNNQMFDIVRKESKNGEIYFYCINDKKEKQIIDNFNQNHDFKRIAFNLLKKISFDKYFPQNIDFNLNILATNYYFNSNKIFYDANIPEIISPTPKSV